MQKSKYKVKYHVILNIYLRTGAELSGCDFSEAWSSLKGLSPRKCTGGFWQKDTVPVKVPRFVAGDSIPYRDLMKIDKNPIFGGCTYTKGNVSRDSTRDCDFYYVHSGSYPWMSADTLPQLMMSVSNEWFKDYGHDKYIAVAKRHFEIADRYEAPYGLIDVSDPNDGYAGMVYGATFFGNSPLHRWIEQAKWVYSAQTKGDRVRNIYWGNYFGKSILECLGGRDDFLKRFRINAQSPDGTPNAHIWEFPNGVFVSLSLDPLDIKPGPPLHGPAVRNALWLVQDLGPRGILNAW